MALNIKNPEVERLVAEVAALTGESKTDAVRHALVERKQRLKSRVALGGRAERARRFLERDIWPLIPESEVGRRLETHEEDAILGYGPDGV